MAGRKGFLYLGVTTVLVFLIATACGEETTTAPPRTSAPVATSAATPAPATSPTPAAKAKVWRIGILDDATTTNVWAMLGPDATAWNFYTQLNRYPFLYGLSDGRFDWIPAWADGFPPPFIQEGELWTTTVKLKNSANWSDGRPITAHDVAFSVNTVLEFQLPGNWQSKLDPKTIARAEALDDQTVKYYFKTKPGLAQWQYGTSGVIFVAKHFWEPLANEAKKAPTLEERRKALFAIVPQNEPTAGEMTFVKWEKGAFVEVQANPQYFFSGSKVVEYKNGAYLEEKPGVYQDVAYGEPTGDITLQYTRGPYASAAIFSVYASQDAAVLALQKGEIDYMATPQGLQRGFQKQLAGKSEIKIITNASNGVRYMGFNTRKAPMNLKEFRQAVAILIDKEFTMNTILQGVADPAYTMVPPGNGFWYNPDVPQLGKGLTREQRIAEAVKLLKGAGFTWELEPKWDNAKRAVEPGKGLKMPDGKPVPEMELLAPSAGYDPLRATFAIWIEQWLKEAGIPVKANLTGFNLIAERVIKEQDMDMWVLGYTLSLYPDYLNSFFHSKRAAKENDNASGYANPAYDALADSLVAETDINKAKETAFRMQQMLAEESPYVLLFTTQILEPVRSNVQFPFEGVLGGLQSYFQSASGPLAFTQIQ